MLFVLNISTAQNDIVFILLAEIRESAEIFCDFTVFCETIITFLAAYILHHYHIFIARGKVHNIKNNF